MQGQGVQGNVAGVRNVSKEPEELEITKGMDAAEQRRRWAVTCSTSASAPMGTYLPARSKSHCVNSRNLPRTICGWSLRYTCTARATVAHPHARASSTLRAVLSFRVGCYGMHVNAAIAYMISNAMLPDLCDGRESGKNNEQLAAGCVVDNVVAVIAQQHWLPQSPLWIRNCRSPHATS